MKICVVGGGGHVGLPLAVVLAEAGHEVSAVDRSEERVRQIQSGVSPFFEPGLDELLRKVLRRKSLSIGNDLAVAGNSDIVIVVVGTDLSESGKPQNESVLEVVKQLREYLLPSATLILRSTVLPGTTACVADALSGWGGEVTFCPERIAEGRALEELQAMPQLVGTKLGVAPEPVVRLFGSLGVEVINMTWEEAELSKLILNTWRYSQFALANEFAHVCEMHGVSFSKIRSAMARQYPRSSGLMAPGFAGGPCLRKDTMQLFSATHPQSELLAAILRHHDEVVERVSDAVVALVGVSEKCVIQLGLTFKPDSDDLRGSVAMELARNLQRRVKNFVVVDPYINSHSEFQMMPLKEALESADLAVVGTRHSEFANLPKSLPIVDLGLLQPKPFN